MLHKKETAERCRSAVFTKTLRDRPKLREANELCPQLISVDYAVIFSAPLAGCKLRVHFLHRNHVQNVHLPHPLHGSFGTCNRGKRGDPPKQSRGTDMA